MSNLVQLAIEYYPESDIGTPVGVGTIYVGIPDTDPTIAGNQKTVSALQENGSLVNLTQPISLSAGGVPLYNGSPVSLYVSGDYSLTVLDINGSQVYYVPSTPGLPLIPGNYYYPDYTEADQGVTGGGSTIKSYIDVIGITNNATIYLKHNSGNEFTDYILLTVETGTSNIFFEFEPGARIKPAAGITLTVYSPGRILADSLQQIVNMSNNSTDPISFTINGTVYPDWFNTNIAPSTTNMTTAIQAAVNSITKGVIKFGSNIYGIETGLTWKGNVEYAGDGKAATTILALAAIDMVTVPNNQYHYKVEGILFDGNSLANTGLLLGDGALQSGFTEIHRVEVKNCDIGIFAEWFFNTDFTQVYIHDNTTVGISIDKGQGNRIHGWLYDNGTDVLFDFVSDSRIDIVSYNLISRVRAIRITNASQYNFITGAFEPQHDSTGGDVILIDDECQGNQIIGASFFANTNVIATADEINYITIGNSADSGPTGSTFVKENKFFELNAANHHVNIQYGNGVVIKDNNTSEVNGEVLINEPDQLRASQTVYNAITDQGRFINTSVNLALTPKNMNKIVYVDCTGGARAVTLPVCEVVDGGKITVMKIDVSGNAITVDRESGTERFQPGGGTSDTIVAQYDYATYQSNGVDWIIMEERA